MAKTALDLGAHWLNFIDEKVKSGRYASADEVVRDALKGLEDQDRKLADVLLQIDEGRKQAKAGVFVDDDFLDHLIEADVEVALADFGADETVAFGQGRCGNAGQREGGQAIQPLGRQTQHGDGM